MKKAIERKGAALLLPDRIMIDTMDRRDAGTWYSTGMPTILPSNVSDVELGDAVLSHVSQSKEEVVTYEQIRENWKTLIKKAGYKTEKAFINDVKRVTVIIEGDKIRFEPFSVNTSQKMFYRLPEAIVETIPVPNNYEIGKEVRKRWEKCLLIP